MPEEASSLGEILTVLVQDRHTTSAINKTNVIGREEDVEVVLKLLSEESNPDDQQSASVIAIVGMGGVGKTALAQNIYHNHSEWGCFDKCMWVCVAKKPKLLDLLKKILEELEPKEEKSSFDNANSIHSKIREHLKDEKFMLVLDDVWDYGWWDGLRSIWQDCGSGSKVLITTRKERVAQAMGLRHSHKLKCLEEEQSWHLLLSKALRERESKERLSIVKDVGKKIAMKCKGLPLALSAVGSLLKQKERSQLEWKKVLDSPLWNWQDLSEEDNVVFSSIALSYVSISYQLKQCLTYCCMYPKDYPMDKKDLVRLWAAEGFILKERGVEIEVTTENCLHALVGCSLIQDAGDGKYKLHDIVHDFCLCMRENEYVSMGELKNALVSDRARYLSSFGGECDSEALKRLDKLRGLMCHKVDCLSADNFDAFRWLRVLDLSGGKFSKLPESIGDLILLKYINLSWTKISELPESITKLSALQTLDLSCSDIRRLPNGISALAALRHLDISGAFYLEYLPCGIGKLTSLQTLPNFVVGSSNISVGMESSLQELGELNNLKGSLIIEHLERVNSFEEVDHAQLERKEDLQSVGLHCDSVGVDKDVEEKVVQVYELMQPPTGIEKISIDGYPGMKCPTWMSSSTYTGLQEISICDCASLMEWQFDAEMGNMPCLRRLSIEECPKLKVIPSFSTLENLKVVNVFEWEGWFTEKERDMPCLKKMQVSACHKLKLLPNCPWLEEMSIESCAQLVELPRFSPVLVSATIKWCHSVSYIQNIEAAKRLEYLEIVACPNLQSLLPGLQSGKLKRLVVKDCPSLASVRLFIRDVLKEHTLPNLQFLQISSRFEAPERFELQGENV